MNINESAKAILQKINLNAIEKNDVLDLRKIILQADSLYYVQDAPVLADQEYDLIFNTLKNLEEKFPEIITPNSPTQRVAQGLTKDFKTVPHLVGMLSLENSYNADDLFDWDRKCKELSEKDTVEYCVEPKYDGASISIIYSNDTMQRGATRGDGVQGDDITANAKQIKSVPLTAAISTYGYEQLEVRGEVMLTKAKFKTFNESLIAKGLSPLANTRNAASGALRMKDPKEVAARGLDVFLYHVSYMHLKQDAVSKINTHFESLKMLHDLGIKSSFPQAAICKNIDEVIAYINKYEEKRDDLPFDIDGMVIKINDFALQEKVGQTTHHPRWAIAFKFKARQATSKLLSVEYQVGRTGSITPVAKIEPVAIGGVMVSSISLHNQDMITEKDIRLGDTILAERAGDVIPYIVKSFPELRNGTETEIQFPTQCPVCNHNLKRPEGEVVWRCVNYNCSAQVVERIIHFASKDAMDIRGFGDANIYKFYELGFLKSIVDIYNLPYNTLRTLDGLGEKSIDKLQEAIEKSKQQNLSRIIYALGIRYVGETTSKTLARSITHLNELSTKTIDDLKQLEDVGIKVAQSIVEFFSDDNNLHIISALDNIGLNLNNNEKENLNSGSLDGKSFLFTGTLSQFKRSEAEAMAEAKGGTIVAGVSAKLNYLIVGEDAGSKLEKAKKLESVVILTEQEFLDMLKD
jgi:DNA ligase (NAD+)